MRKPKIALLTPEQIDRFGDYVERWTAIGLCTAPADRPQAEAGVRAAYEAAELTPPELIVWCGSPMSQGLTRAIVLSHTRDSVRDSVGASVRDSVRDSVWDSVGASVWASVGASVWDSVGASVWASVGASGYGQHDAGWLSFYRYFHDVLGLTDETQRLNGL